MAKLISHKFYLYVFVLFFGLNTATTAYAENIQTLIDIGNHHQLYLRCEGKGSPTVILESGFRNDSDVWTVSYLGKQAVFPAVAKFTQVCTYDRPGTIGWEADKFSRSSAQTMPRTAQSVVTDLHALLQAAHVKPPFVMVGHSLGGLFVRLYASTYPKDVVGMVLVDSFSEKLRDMLSKKDWSAYQYLTEQPPVQLKEYKDLEQINFDAASTAMAQAQKTNPLQPMPLIIISRGKASEIPVSAEISQKILEQAWRKSQHSLTALTPHAKFIIAKQSEHYVQFFQPELVISAIHQTVEKVRLNRSERR